jgi:hypothetical protein
MKLHVTPDQYALILKAVDKATRTLDGHTDDTVLEQELKVIFDAPTLALIKQNPIELIVDYR